MATPDRVLLDRGRRVCVAVKPLVMFEHHSRAFGLVGAVSIACCLLAPGAVYGQVASASEARVAPLVVTAATPLAAQVAADAQPVAVITLSADDLRRTGPPGALRALDERAAGVSLNAAQGNPLQPNLLYRGFEASPLAGDAQGLAVYVGGVRFNLPFGDTIDWDLIPDAAVERIDLVGSNPVFGLNALGGALAVRLKDGFSAAGGALDLSGGSFGRAAGDLEWSARSGDTALYGAVQGFREDGWREHSPSSAAQVYGDLGWRPPAGEFHLNFLAADTDLTGNGTVPVQLLAIDRAAVFTYPDETRNRFARLASSGDVALGRGLALEARAYVSRFDQTTANGDAGGAVPCLGDAALLCGLGGGVLTGPDGRAIDDFVHGSPYIGLFPQFAGGGPYATLNTTRTGTTEYGAAFEVTDTRRIARVGNRAVAGASFDASVTGFAAATVVGGLSLDRSFVGPGVLIDQADGSIAPVSIRAADDDLGLFFSESLDVTPTLTLDLSGRYNLARVQLRDRLGAALNGDHAFDRFNPAIGFDWRPLPGLTVYGDYAEANRAPTPAELSCASPAAPCSLTNFFVGDPGLRQVVTRTLEAGLRGRFSSPAIDLRWHAGLYRATSDDDIQFVASPTIGRDYFANVGSTRRQGLDGGAELERGALSLFVDYAFTDATYQNALVLDGGQNPAANPAGLILVRPGDRIPGVPRANLKFAARWRLGGGWDIGVDGSRAGSRYLVGDAANLNPPIPGYWLFDLDIRYQATPRLAVFARIENLTDTRYATFGDFSPTGDVPILQDPAATNPRSLSPGQPTAAFAGLTLKF